MKNDLTKILVVENEYTKEFIDHVKETNVYHLTTVKSGQDVLDYLHKYGDWYSEHVDVMILEMVMPEVPGFELIKIVKRNPKTENIRTILLGDREGAQAMVDALFGGASDYVVKPFDVSELIARIDNQLRLERKEKTQREIEARYQAVISMAEGVIVQDVHERIVMANPSAERILGVTQEQMIKGGYYFPAWHAITKDGTPMGHDDFPTKITLRTGEPLSNVTMGIQRPESEVGDGEDVWVSSYITWLSINTRPLLHSGEEIPYAVVASFSDMTENKLMQDALGESESKFRALTEFSPCAIFIIQGEHYVYINPTFEALTGYNLEEISKIKFWELVPGEMSLTVMEQGLTRQFDDRPALRTWHKILAKNGVVKWLDYIASRIIYNGQPALLGTAVDITEYKQTEEALRESRSLADLGLIAAGIAQEIYNPIDLCASAAARLKRKADIGADKVAEGNVNPVVFQEVFSTISESIELLQLNLKRAVEIIEGFKRVAYDQVTQEKKIFLLRETIEETLAHLKPEIDQANHRIHLICPDDLYVHTYPAAIVSIITNLVMNSLIHGFEGLEHGNIRIDVSKKTELINVSQGDQDSIMREPIQNVFIEIRYNDDGKGMTSEQIEQLYIPFSAKPAEGGGGLRLHLVHTLVTQTLGGSIGCLSAPGEETAFLIRIPLDLDYPDDTDR